ncbi:MAG: hypothetical protein AB7G23_01060 [Vicinamibacterales bacterium]
MRHQLLGFVIALALATPAAAQTPWSVSFNVGGDISLSGDVHDGGLGRVQTLPTAVGARTYGDVHGTPLFWSADLGYGLGQRGEARARLLRSSGSASRVQVGTVASLPLFAQFSDWDAWGVDFGYRQYLRGSGIRPFVGGNVGFLAVDANSGTFTVPEASVTLPNVSMTGNSTVPIASLAGGAEWPLNQRLSLVGSVDFRWQGNLDPVDGLAGTGLERINDRTRRWSMPVTAGAAVRF